MATAAAVVVVAVADATTAAVVAGTNCCCCCARTAANRGDAPVNPQLIIRITLIPIIEMYRRQKFFTAGTYVMIIDYD